MLPGKEEPFGIRTLGWPQKEAEEDRRITRFRWIRVVFRR